MSAPTVRVPAARRLNAVLARNRRAARPSLIGSLPAGYPSVEGSLAALRVLSRHVDVLEVGLPYPNAVLDSPSTQAASQRAVAAGVVAADVIDVLRELTASVSVPVVLRSYWEPIARIGAGNLAAALDSAGAAGAVLPDLHPHGHGAAQWLRAATTHRFVSVFHAAQGRGPAAAERSTGWLHLPIADETGPDGTESVESADGSDGDGTDVLDMVRLRRRALLFGHQTPHPICAGGGISSPSQAEAVAPWVDGLVIGSAFVRALMYAPTVAEGLICLDQRAARFAAAVRPCRGGQYRAVAA